MSIGETLAGARQQAALSVAEVSRRTRIREALIRDIENDDYSECGGDFYARGHIRSIAKAVGIDPEPLVHEYDQAYRGPDAITDVMELVTASRAAMAEEQQPEAPAGPEEPWEQPWEQPREQPWEQPRALAGPGEHRRPRPALWLPERRRLNWAAVLAVAVVIAAGVLGFELLTGSSQPPSPAAQAARTHGATHAPATRGSGSPAAQHSPSAAATPTPSPTASPAAATRTMTPASAAAFGTGGAGQGDNPGLASLAIDGNPGTAWHSDWYTTANFGNLYSGTGLLLDLGHYRTLTGARISLGSAPGADFQLRVGSSPSLAALHPVARETGASGMVHLHLASPAHGRYVLIWFTQLPDNGGSFQASVHEVRLTVRT